MQESLFSPLWYKYSILKPKVKSQVKISTQAYRDQQWYIFTNTSNSNQFRVNEIAYALVGRFDGKFTVQQIWQSVIDQLGNDALTQTEVIHILNELDQKEFLLYDVVPDMPNLFQRGKQKVKDKRNSFINPFAFRIPLWNPSQVLKKCAGLSSLIFNKTSLIIWMALIFLGFCLLVSNWRMLYVHATANMSSSRYLLIAWLSFPIIKFFHELSHALAVQRWGGEVNEVGITLFMITPAPYVDATDANRFKSKTQRMLVSAIGIMTELFIAAFALIIYLNAQPGYVKDIAFVVAFICSVSTLFFNGNPLLRFDAYYAMCDFFSLPNLASRSRLYWNNKISSFIVGKQYVKPLSLAEGEKKWLFSYAPLSMLYMFIVMFGLVIWLGKVSSLLGIMALGYVVVLMLIKPLGHLYKAVVSAAPVGIQQLKVKSYMMVGFTLLLLGFLFLPVANNTDAQGIVWVPDQARLRPESEGIIRQIMVKNGEQVSSGQTILILENADLILERENLKSQLAKLDVDQFNAMFTNPEQSATIAEQIKKLNADLDRNQEKINGLHIKSQLNGKLVMPYQLDKLGVYAKKGEMLGYVLNDDHVQLRVALDARYVAQVNHQLNGIEVKTAEHPEETLEAELVMMTPSATNSLPSAALSEVNGGRFATDPQDKESLKTLQPIVVLDLRLLNASFPRAGGKAYVRFNHVKQPLASQLYQYTKQVFLSQFNAST